MDEFDYLDLTVSEWLDMSGYKFTDSPYDIVTAIQEQYLPAFEAAIWKRSAEVA